MKRKSKGLVQLLIFISLALSLFGCFFIWDASTKHPLAAGDRLLLAPGQPGELATIGMTLYNNGPHPISLQGVQLDGAGWELSAAQITTGLSYTSQPLGTWATGQGTTLTPVNGFRMDKYGKATLGLTLKRTHLASDEKTHLVVTYRLWFFTRQLQIALR